MTRGDIERRFNYHEPDESRATRHEMVRSAMKQAAYVVLDTTLPGREQSLALTKLEEAMMWANAAIARE